MMTILEAGGQSIPGIGRVRVSAGRQSERNGFKDEEKEKRREQNVRRKRYVDT